MASPRYFHTTTGPAVIPERGWLHMYSCIAGPTDPAVIQMTNADGPLDPITVPAGSSFSDTSSDPARGVIVGPMTIEITDAANFMISWFVP